MDYVIYCISGLGADEKIFAHLDLRGYELRHIPWLTPFKNEKIEAYSKRMAASIQHDSPILIGVSFGGIIAIEIARQMPLRKLILISTIKSTREMPNWMKMAGVLNLDKLIPIRPYKFTEKLGNDRLGVSNPEERELVNGYREKSDPVYLHWAVRQIIHWKNDWLPNHAVHIHGDKDKIFPVKRIRASHIIQGGTHLMLVNRAAEISKVINGELAK